MATTDDRVMEMVEKEIRKNPDVSSTDLFEKAKKAVSSMAELTLRQFHARYPLQVKRRMALAEGGTKAPARKSRRSRPKAEAGRRGRRARNTSPDPSAGKDKVRQVLLRFAADLTAAEARKDLVKVLAGVDRYVDDVLKATK